MNGKRSRQQDEHHSGGPRGRWLRRLRAALAAFGRDGEITAPAAYFVDQATDQTPSDLHQAITAQLQRAREAGSDCVALLLEGRPEGQGCDSRQIRIRLRAALRIHDLVLPTGEGRFLILARLTQSRAEGAAMRLAQRLADATSPDWGASDQSTSCLGVIALQNGHDWPEAGALLAQLTCALTEASALGAGSIRMMAAPPYAGPIRLPAAPQTHDTPPASLPAPEENAAGTICTRALFQALENGEIRAYFQPQISADTGEVTGFEALARWHHPQQGILSPQDFLPAIEAAGLTSKLGNLMRRQALEALRVWVNAGYPVQSVSVNVTHQDLRDPQFATDVLWQLDRAELPPGRLVLEVLETVAAAPGRATIVDNLTRLAQAGCRLDLDDFGIGPGALDSLRDFPVHRLKIDRSFVSGADHDPEQRRMLVAILSMAEQLKVETVAEGVETRAEASLLAQFGCQHLQGFAIAPPMALEDTPLFMERQRNLIAGLPRIRRA